MVLYVNDVETRTLHGIPRADLIEWVLEQRENEIESLAQLAEERALLERVVKRLIKDRYLVELPIDDARRVQGGPELELLVHPQVDIDSINERL